jgi:thiamine-phosphate pyrophosphorylase
VYRVLDANLNRLREALRVVEEYARFLAPDADLAAQLKRLRHAVQPIEQDVGQQRLLASRDTGSDPFSSHMQPEEQDRDGLAGVVRANLKRGQEASRVLEEYLKVLPAPAAAESAKRIRFELYAVEKRVLELLNDGGTKKAKQD